MLDADFKFSTGFCAGLGLVGAGACLSSRVERLEAAAVAATMGTLGLPIAERSGLRARMNAARGWTTGWKDNLAGEILWDLRGILAISGATLGRKEGLGFIQRRNFLDTAMRLLTTVKVVEETRIPSMRRFVILHKVRYCRMDAKIPESSTTFRIRETALLEKQLIGVKGLGVGRLRSYCKRLSLGCLLVCARRLCVQLWHTSLHGRSISL